ncbi:MAG: UDP-N-acetylmuramoyl-L-alanine--D-glutamate ligase [Myxococcaceae bacterium]
MSSLPSLSGCEVVVLGAGKSGLAAARLLGRAGARVTVLDGQPLQALSGVRAPLEAAGAELRAGQSLETVDLGTPELVVVSPGVPLSLPSLQKALGRGIPVWGEVELAGRFLAQGVPVVAITGTNGKSTTTALCGALCAEGGLRPFVGGNLGTPLSDAVEGPVPGAYVVELSSFQLEGVHSLEVRAAALLNLTPDHLDRYPSMQAYAEAKARIFQNQGPQDLAVLNLDDAWTPRFAAELRAPARGFTLDGRTTLPGGFLGAAVASPQGFCVLSEDLLFRVDSRALRGAHNLQNAMAATLLALHLGVRPEQVQRGLDGFPGLPHRLESVRVLDGVEWVNDSKATNVDAAVVALQAFPVGSRLWLLAGGKGKGAPYAPLRKAAGGKVAAVLTLGQDGPLIEEEFATEYTVHACFTLERAVARARELARPGDVVLLSPACASFDQFLNFEDRGDTFRRLVKALS